MLLTAALTEKLPDERYHEERLRFEEIRLVRLGVEGDVGFAHDDEMPVLG